MTEQPNILLICVDQWRGDCLGSANHPVVRTPYLDQLAAGGARFAHAYSATPSCIPARAALYTGLSPRTHGRVGGEAGIRWTYPTTMAGEFTRHGYQTQAIGKMNVVPERAQMGFQNVVLHDGYSHYSRRRDRDWGRIDDYLPWLREKTGDPYADYFEHGVNCNSFVARPWDKPEHLHPTNWTVTQGLEFLRRRDEDKPFFLYMSFHRPHAPFDPPAWAFDMYRDVPLTPRRRGDWEDAVLSPLQTPGRADAQVVHLPDRDLQRTRAGYYGHMTHIDHQINRFLEGMGEFGVARNTYVCFVSDHGEMLGDHDCFRKALPYEGSIRIPFLLYGPRSSGIQAGMVPVGTDGAPVVTELRDILPTLLDCAGLPIPDAVEGRSILPFARGETVPDWRRDLHSEHFTFGQSLQWLTDGRQKYIWWSGTGREQFFDLAADPDELRDLAADPALAETVAAWREKLARELSGRPEGFVAPSGALVPGRPVSPSLPHLSAGKP